MATNPLQSASMRFLRTFGVAFFWAVLVGVVLGSAVFFRVDRQELNGDLRWHVALRLLLERVEWVTSDWRARQLGDASERTDEVVLVTVDEETLVNARESGRPEWAMRPWPRALLGEVAEQLVREGARLVVIDEAFSDVSPHHCAPCGGESGQSDDERFAAVLERLGGKVVLGYDWRREGTRPADRPLLPVLVRVGDTGDEDAALRVVQAVLKRGAPAYLTPVAGRTEVWAGTASEAKARELAASFDPRGAVVTRGLTPADDAAEVTRTGLLRRLAGTSLGALDAARVPAAATLEAPVSPLLSPAIGLGALRLLPDPDGVVRAVPLLVRASRGTAEGEVLASLSLRAAQVLAEGAPLRLEGARLRVGTEAEAPIDPGAFHTLHWNAGEAGRGGRGTLKRAVPAWRVLQNREDDVAGHGVRRHDNELAGRVVVLSDDRVSPRVMTPVGELSRAAVWAQGLADLLKGQGISRVVPEVDFWLTVAFALAGGVLAVAWSSLTRRPGWLAWVVTLGVVVGVHALIARQLYVTQQRQVAMAAPLLACGLTFLASLGYARALEQSLRDFMLRALGGAVRADVFRRVQRDLALMRPERRELTVFFSDIEGFTEVADQQEPRLVVRVLQDYLGDMTTLVLDQGGHVDKYLGDGLMAFWGAPVTLPNDAAAACEAALRMQARFEQRRAEWERACGRPLVLRAGLETGLAVVGEMGTLHRVNYTVMGEPVATAFRLESLAKRYGVRMLAGAGVAAEAATDFTFREVDVLRLHRSGRATELFELLGPAAAFAGAEWLTVWGEAVAAFRARRFDEALARFRAVAAQRPDDPLAARYVARSEAFVATPPAEGWGGSVIE